MIEHDFAFEEEESLSQQSSTSPYESRRFNSNSTMEEILLDNDDDDGVFDIPKQPRFDTFEARLETFTGWSEQIAQQPKALSESGFYYTQRLDIIRLIRKKN